MSEEFIREAIEYLRTKLAELLEKDEEVAFEESK